MIISGGQNIHSAEIESTLLRIPGVKDCAVIGLPDYTWGERVAAVIVADDPASVTLERIREFCRPRIAGFKIPRELFVQTEPLPRTPTGKVQKFRLVERYHPGNGLV
jgi:fatty-acyl-CoA synthase